MASWAVAGSTSSVGLITSMLITSSQLGQADPGSTAHLFDDESRDVHPGDVSDDRAAAHDELVSRRRSPFISELKPRHAIARVVIHDPPKLPPKTNYYLF